MRLNELYIAGMKTKNDHPSEYADWPAHVVPLNLDVDQLGWDLERNLYFCGKQLVYEHRIALTKNQSRIAAIAAGAAAIAALATFASASAQWYTIICGT